MPKFPLEVDTDKGRVRVVLDSVPESRNELIRKIQDEIIAGRAQPIGTPFQLPQQTAIPRMVRGVQQQQAPSFGEFALDVGKKSALPTAGAIAGGFVPPPFTPFAISALSTAGEAANQALGITKRSNLQLGLAGGLPLLGAAGSGAARVGKSLLTGRRAANLLNRIGPREAQKFVAGLRPSESADELFTIARQSGEIIEAGKALESINESLQIFERASKGSRAAFAKPMRILRGLKDRIEEQGGLLPDQFQAELEALGDIQQTFAKGGGTGAGRIKRTIGALLDDLLETPAGIPLLRAREVFLRGKTVEEIESAISSAIKARRGLGELTQFNPNEVITKLQKNRFFEKAFTPQEQKEIFSLFKKINRIPVLGPPPGAAFGSGPFFETLTRMGFAGGAGALVGSQFGAPGAGAAIGITLPPTLRFSRDLALTLQFREGRQLVKQLLTGSDGAITPRIAAILSAFVRSIFSQQGTQQ